VNDFLIFGKLLFIKEKWDTNNYLGDGFPPTIVTTVGTFTRRWWRIYWLSNNSYIAPEIYLSEDAMACSGIKRGCFNCIWEDFCNNDESKSYEDHNEECKRWHRNKWVSKYKCGQPIDERGPFSDAFPCIELTDWGDCLGNESCEHFINKNDLEFRVRVRCLSNNENRVFVSINTNTNRERLRRIFDNGGQHE
jgi:hypothetical protein